MKPIVAPLIRCFAACALVLCLAPLAAAAPDLPTVGVTPARLVKMAPITAVPGTVVSRSDSQLASEVEGRVAWVAEVGTVVAANDVVARVDSSLAGMQLASDRANVARLAAQLRFDRNQAERMDNLFKQNAIARSTRDQAEATRDMDAAALAQAPIDSTRYVRETMPLTVEIQGKPVVTQVRAIVPVGDIVSRTIEIRLVLPKGAGLVGDAAKVMVPTAQPHDAIAVSRDALVLREDNTYVFKVDARGVVQRVAVETGVEQGVLVEIRGGIAQGDRVIVRGAERLAAGQKVRAVPIS